MIPTSEVFSDKCQELGLSVNEQFIVYATPGAASAPRVWWMFKLFGIEKVSVMDGGLEAWKAIGGPTISGEVAAVEPGMSNMYWVMYIV
jgi:thiosulfate/3-mercaptopyruvate sulfurtransferase